MGLEQIAEGFLAKAGITPESVASAKDALKRFLGDWRQWYDHDRPELMHHVRATRVGVEGLYVRLNHLEEKLGVPIGVPDANGEHATLEDIEEGPDQ